TIDPYALVSQRTFIAVNSRARTPLKASAKTRQTASHRRTFARSIRSAAFFASAFGAHDASSMAVLTVPQMRSGPGPDGGQCGTRPFRYRETHMTIANTMPSMIIIDAVAHQSRLRWPNP